MHFDPPRKRGVSLALAPRSAVVGLGPLHALIPGGKHLLSTLQHPLRVVSGIRRTCRKPAAGGGSPHRRCG